MVLIWHLFWSIMNKLSIFRLWFNKNLNLTFSEAANVEQAKTLPTTVLPFEIFVIQMKRRSWQNAQRLCYSWNCLAGKTKHTTLILIQDLNYIGRFQIKTIDSVQYIVRLFITVFLYYWILLILLLNHNCQ